MIRLTMLDGSEIFVNPDLIELIEETPDTHIRLANGNRYLVLEPAAVIIDRIVALKARILHRSQPGSGKKYLRRRQLAGFLPACPLKGQDRRDTDC